MAGYSTPTPTLITPNSASLLRYSLAGTNGSNTVFGFGQTTTNGSYTSGPTLNVVSTAGFPNSGTLTVSTSTFTYSGVTPTSFTVLSRTGSGTIASGTAVIAGDTATINASLPSVGNTLFMAIKVSTGVTVSSIKDTSGNANTWRLIDSTINSKAPTTSINTYIYAQPVTTAYSNSGTQITVTYSATTSVSKAVWVAEFSGVYNANNGGYPSIAATTSATNYTNSFSYNMGLNYASATANVASPVGTPSASQTIANVNSSNSFSISSSTAAANFPVSTGAIYNGATITNLTSVTSIPYLSGLPTIFPNFGAIIILTNSGYAVYSYTSVDYVNSILNGISFIYSTSGSTIANGNVMYPAYNLTVNTTSPTGTATIYYSSVSGASFNPAVATSGSGNIATTTNSAVGNSGYNTLANPTIAYTAASTTFTGATGTTVSSILSSQSIAAASTSSFPTPVIGTNYSLCGYITLSASGGTLIFSYTGLTSNSFTGLLLLQGDISWTLTNGATITNPSFPASNEETQLYNTKTAGYTVNGLAYSTSTSPNLVLIGSTNDNINVVKTGDILSMGNGIPVSNGLILSIAITNSSSQTFNTIPSGFTQLATGSSSAFYYSNNGGTQPTTTPGNLSLPWGWNTTGYFANTTVVVYSPILTTATATSFSESDNSANPQFSWLNNGQAIAFAENENSAKSNYSQILAGNAISISETETSLNISSIAAVLGSAISATFSALSNVIAQASVLLKTIAAAESDSPATVSESLASVSAPMPITYVDKTATVKTYSIVSGNINIAEVDSSATTSTTAKLSPNIISKTFAILSGSRTASTIANANLISAQESEKNAVSSASAGTTGNIITVSESIQSSNASGKAAVSSTAISSSIVVPTTSYKAIANVSGTAINTSIDFKSINAKLYAIMLGQAIKTRLSIGSPPRNLIKSIYIGVKGIILHSQTYNPNGWSVTNDQNPNDFAIAEEQEELVPPTTTSFDYSINDDLDPTDTGIPNQG